MKKLTPRKLRKLIENEVHGWFKNSEGKNLKLGQPISDVGIEAITNAWAGGKNLVMPQDIAKEVSGHPTVQTLEIMKITESQIIKESKKLKVDYLDEQNLRKIIKSLIRQ